MNTPENKENNLAEESQILFDDIKKNKKTAVNSYEHILSVINTALSERRYDSLTELYSFIINGEGKYAYNYIGRTNRILRILKIIIMEREFNKALFCTDCQNFDMLWEKYLLTVFAMRRILFRLSDQSVSEAVMYLQNNPVSVIAAHILSSEEVMLPDDRFYDSLISCYSNIWTANDVSQLLSLKGGN